MKLSSVPSLLVLFAPTIVASSFRGDGITSPLRAIDGADHLQQPQPEQATDGIHRRQPQSSRTLNDVTSASSNQIEMQPYFDEIDLRDPDWRKRMFDTLVRHRLCFRGTIEDIMRWCGKDCCVGNNACHVKHDGNDSAAGVKKEYSICKNTCKGDSSCSDILGSIPIFPNTCIGDRSCELFVPSSYGLGPNACIGEEACAASAFHFEFHTARGACVGAQACHQLYSWEDRTVAIADGSCMGDNACIRLGEETRNDVLIGELSCIGRRACSGLGRSASSVTIGDGSCVGEQACWDLGESSNGDVIVNDGLCNEKNICNEMHLHCGIEGCRSSDRVGVQIDGNECCKQLPSLPPNSRSYSPLMACALVGGSLFLILSMAFKRRFAKTAGIFRHVQEGERGGFELRQYVQIESNDDLHHPNTDSTSGE